MINDLNPVRIGNNNPTEPDTKRASHIHRDKVSSPDEVKVTPQQVQEFNLKRFDREKRGKYVLIFPFSKSSEQLAVELNRSATGTAGAGHCLNVGGPNLMKQLVGEVRTYYDERLQFFKGKQASV